MYTRRAKRLAFYGLRSPGLRIGCTYGCWHPRPLSIQHAGVAGLCAKRHFDGAAHRVHNAAELDNRPIAGALNYAAMVHNVQGINEIAADRPKPRQGTIFISAGKPAVTDHVSHQDRRYFPGLAHGASAEARSPVAFGLGMAAFPCCTDDARRPGMQARLSVISLAALVSCL
jgi:hypothetical protein